MSEKTTITEDQLKSASGGATNRGDGSWGNPFLLNCCFEDSGIVVGDRRKCSYRYGCYDQRMGGEYIQCECFDIACNRNREHSSELCVAHLHNT